MKKSFSFPVGLCLLVCAGVFLSGCTSVSKSSGKPLPEMTYSHIAPLYVSVSVIDIETQYDPQKDPLDVSSTFPTPPDIVLRRYANNRIKPQQGSVGAGGTLKFIIEDASVHWSYIKPQDRLAQWLRKGRDRYDILIRLRLYQTFPNGSQSAHSVLTFEHYLEVPESLSLVEREREQIGFLEKLVQNVDEAVSKSLRNTLNIVSGNIVSGPSSSVPVFLQKPVLIQDPISWQ